MSIHIHKAKFEGSAWTAECYKVTVGGHEAFPTEIMNAAILAAKTPSNTYIYFRDIDNRLICFNPPSSGTEAIGTIIATTCHGLIGLEDGKIFFKGAPANDNGEYKMMVFDVGASSSGVEYFDNRVDHSLGSYTDTGMYILFAAKGGSPENDSYSHTLWRQKSNDRFGPTASKAEKVSVSLNSGQFSSHKSTVAYKAGSKLMKVDLSAAYPRVASQIANNAAISPIIIENGSQAERIIYGKIGASSAKYKLRSFNSTDGHDVVLNKDYRFGDSDMNFLKCFGDKLFLKTISDSNKIELRRVDRDFASNSNDPRVGNATNICDYSCLADDNDIVWIVGTDDLSGAGGL